MTRGRALVVDPGKMTGWGFLEWDTTDLDATTFWGGEKDHDSFIDWSSQLLSGVWAPALDPPSLIICEGFTINKRTTEQAPDDTKMWSVKQIGHLETLCRWYGLPFVRQMPSDKAFDADGAKLKALGWWAPSAGVKGEKGHRRDAGRHAVKYATDHQLINLRRLIP